MHKVHDLNDNVGLLREVLEHKMQLLYTHVQLNTNHIIHSMFLDPFEKIK
jgi:hypothetical protein